MAAVPAGYCEVGDLLLRDDLQLPTGIDAQKYINDAAEEIDSKIGHIYRTPVTLTPQDSQTYRTTFITLKRTNAHLATGRIIMAISSPTEESELDAYGNFLIRDATAMIKQISDRVYILEGAPPNTNAPSEHAVSRGYVSHLDDTSSVEAFYGLVNPSRGYDYPSSGHFLNNGMGG